jgi:hypothetical protein
MTKTPLDIAKELFKKKAGLEEQCEMPSKLLRLQNCKTVEDLCVWVLYWKEIPYGDDAKTFVFKVIEQGTKAWD